MREVFKKKKFIIKAETKSIESNCKNNIIKENAEEKFERLSRLPADALLKVSEVAILLRVNRTTVYELMYHEGLKYKKIGSYKIKKAWVDEFINASANAA